MHLYTKCLERSAPGDAVGITKYVTRHWTRQLALPHARHAKDLPGVDIVAVIESVRLRDDSPRDTVFQRNAIQMVAPPHGVIATEWFWLRHRFGMRHWFVRLFAAAIPATGDYKDLTCIDIIRIVQPIGT